MMRWQSVGSGQSQEGVFLKKHFVAYVAGSRTCAASEHVLVASYHIARFEALLSALGKDVHVRASMLIRTYTQSFRHVATRSSMALAA